MYGMGWECKSEYHLDPKNGMAEELKDGMMGEMLDWRLRLRLCIRR